MSDFRAVSLTWFALLVLLVITAGSSEFDLGWGNLAINLAIAAAKTALIALVFMHLGRAVALLRIAVGVALFWLALLYVQTFADYVTR